MVSILFISEEEVLVTQNPARGYQHIGIAIVVLTVSKSITASVYERSLCMVVPRCT